MRSTRTALGLLRAPQRLTTHSCRRWQSTDNAAATDQFHTEKDHFNVSPLESTSKPAHDMDSRAQKADSTTLGSKLDLSDPSALMKFINPESSAPIRFLPSGRPPSRPDTKSKALPPSKTTGIQLRPQPESMTTRMVNVRVGPGDSQAFGPLFLRDCCTCPKCVDPSTSQKLFATTDIPPRIEARTVDLDSTHLNLTWDNDIPGYESDHTTRIPISFLADSIVRPNLGTQSFWSKLDKHLWDAAEFEKSPHTIPYHAYMNDDSVLLSALHQLKTHGLLFLSDVPEAESSVRAIAERIGPLKNTFYGSTWDVRSIPDAKNVAYTNQNLGFHMDLLYMEQPPRLQFLHCLKASPVGGTSLFTDAYRGAIKLLRKDTRKFLNLKRLDVQFHYDNDGQYYSRRRKVFTTGDGYVFDAATLRNGLNKKQSAESDATLARSLNSINWSPPFQGPFRHSSGSGALSASTADWQDSARAFCAEVESPEAIYSRQMPPGECVIFDNLRVLHARTAFQNNSERWLRGAYVDEEAWHSALTVLEKKYPQGCAEESVVE